MPIWGVLPHQHKIYLQVPLNQPLLLTSCTARGQGQALSAVCADSVSPVLDYKNKEIIICDLDYQSLSAHPLVQDTLESCWTPLRVQLRLSL